MNGKEGQPPGSRFRLCYQIYKSKHYTHAGVVNLRTTVKGKRNIDNCMREWKTENHQEVSHNFAI